MPKSALFFVFPTLSHYRSFKPLVESYKMLGYEVVYTRPGEKASIEKSVDDFYLTTPYLSEYYISNSRSFFTILVHRLLDPSFNKIRKQEYFDTVDKIRNAVRAANPETIILDAHLSSYYLFLSDLCSDIKVAYTKLLSNRHPGIPPLYIKYPIFRKNRVGMILSEIFWKRHSIKTEFRNLFEKIAFNGLNLDSFQRSTAKKYGVNHEQYVLSPRDCSFNFLELSNKITKVILAPHALEYSWRKLYNNESYFVPENVPSFDKLANFPAVVEFISKFKLARQLNPDVKLIYCSLGFIATRESRVINFYHLLRETFRERKNHYLILSTSGSSIDFPDSYDNIICAEYMPQKEIIPLCDLVISHGGVNTIRECLGNNLPMLLLPKNHEYDQPGNCARVVSKRFGLVASLEKLDKYQLASQIKICLELGNRSEILQ